jgi:hypothetical protein
VRYPRLAEVLRLFSRAGDGYGDGKDDEQHVALAMALLDRVPDKASLLARYGESWRMNGWSGSAATIIDRRRLLLAPLREHADLIVRSWATALDARMAEAAEQDRQSEQALDRREERFE